MPDRLTASEMRDRFFTQVKKSRDHWLEQPGTDEDRMNGLLGSVFAMMDGTSEGSTKIPKMIFMSYAYDGDTAFQPEEGDWWPVSLFEEGTQDICFASPKLHIAWESFIGS